MTVLEIVRKWIEDNGRDGLVNGDAECGCRLDDLEPCSEMSSRCEPAYKRDARPGDDPDWGDWVMDTEKPCELCTECCGVGTHRYDPTAPAGYVKKGFECQRCDGTGHEPKDRK